MTTRVFTFIGLFLLTLPAVSFADPDEVARFELSLAGYQIGMSIDDASQVRPFHYFNALEKGSLKRPQVTIGHLDNVFIDEVNFAITAHFSRDRLWKIISRFPAKDFETVRKRLLQTLGQGEDKSQLVKQADGLKARTEIYRWVFPTANLSLVGPARSNFATIAVIETTPQPGEQGEPRPAANE